MRFKDKIVLITGSAGGIGFKTALDFGNEGAIVAVTDIDFEMAKKLSNQIISFQKNIENFNPKKTYFYLPPSSFHMTLFDCCNLNTKNTNYWPSDIDPDMHYKDIAVELNKRIENYNFPEELNFKLKMFFGGYSIILEPFS